MTAVLEKAVEKIQKKFQKDEKEKKLFPDAMKTSFSEGQQNIIDGKVIPYIQEHFSETLTVTEIADYAALNAQYMMRLFKKRTAGICYKLPHGKSKRTASKHRLEQ